MMGDGGTLATPVSVQCPYILSNRLNSHASDYQMQRNKEDIVTLQKSLGQSSSGTSSFKSISAEQRAEVLRSVKFPYWRFIRLWLQLLERVGITHHCSLPFMIINIRLFLNSSKGGSPRNPFFDQDMYLLEEFTHEWKDYTELYLQDKNMRHEYSVDEIKTFLSSVLWNELCDSENDHSSFLFQTASKDYVPEPCHFCQITDKPHASHRHKYIHPLWTNLVSFKHSQYSAKDLYLPLLGIHYTQTNRSFVQYFMFVTPLPKTVESDVFPIIKSPSIQIMIGQLNSNSTFVETKIIPPLQQMDCLQRIMQTHAQFGKMITRMYQRNTYTSTKGRCMYTFLFENSPSFSASDWKNEHWFSLFTLKLSATDVEKQVRKNTFISTSVSPMPFVSSEWKKQFVAHWVSSDDHSLLKTSTFHPSFYCDYIQQMHQKYLENSNFQHLCEKEFKVELNQILNTFVVAFLKYAWFYEASEVEFRCNEFQKHVHQWAKINKTVPLGRFSSEWKNRIDNVTRTIVDSQKTMNECYMLDLVHSINQFNEYMFKKTCYYLWKGVVFFESDQSLTQNIPLLYAQEMLVRFQNGVGEGILNILQTSMATFDFANENNHSDLPFLLSFQSPSTASEGMLQSRLFESVRYFMLWPHQSPHQVKQSWMECKKELEQMRQYLHFKDVPFLYFELDSPSTTSLEKMQDPFVNAALLYKEEFLSIQEVTPRLKVNEFMVWIQSNDEVTQLVEKQKDILNPLQFDLVKQVHGVMNEWKMDFEKKAKLSPWVARWMHSLTLGNLHEQHKQHMMSYDDLHDSLFQCVSFLTLIDMFVRIQMHLSS